MNERQKRILEYARNFLLANLGEEAEWIFGGRESEPTESEITEAFVVVGVPSDIIPTQSG